MLGHLDHFGLDLAAQGANLHKAAFLGAGGFDAVFKILFEVVL